MGQLQDLPDELVVQILAEAVNKPGTRIPVYEPLQPFRGYVCEDIAYMDLINDIGYRFHGLRPRWYTVNILRDWVRRAFAQDHETIMMFTRAANLEEILGDRNRFCQIKISEAFAHFRIVGSLRLVSKKIHTLVPQIIKSHFDSLSKKCAVSRMVFARIDKVFTSALPGDDSLEHREQVRNYAAAKWLDTVFDLSIAVQIFNDLFTRVYRKPFCFTYQGSYSGKSTATEDLLDSVRQFGLWRA